MAKKTKLAHNFLRNLAKFGRNKSGQVGLLLGLSAVPIVGVTGLAFDYSRKIEAQAATQAALDGAALAATSALNAGEDEAAYKKVAQDFFDRNKPDNLIGNPVVKVVLGQSGGSLTVITDASIKTTMSGVFGFKSIILTNDLKSDPNDSSATQGGFGATVSLPTFTPEQKGEVIFVMDYSGSMNWYLGGERKYQTMRNEAAKLVNALSQTQTNQYVKFGVVPFSSEVYATMPKSNWVGFSGSGNRSSCTRDRLSPLNLGDSSPTSSTATKYGQVVQSTQWVQTGGHHGGWQQMTLPSNDPTSYYYTQGWENYRSNCASYAGWRNLVVQDLTVNHTDTYNKILSMRPYGNTHIAVGMEFGYQLLSPNAPFTNGVSYGDSTTEKAVILLTDGAQTTRAFGPGGQYGVSNGEQNLATLCTNMKNDGIRIITISYDLYNATAENRLKNCATDADDFYNADTKPELVASFSEITSKLSRDMYLAK